ncbi:LOW QUALITY PROTEIN: hypothetical protein HID58_056088, partial [Brassica napus]
DGAQRKGEVFGFESLNPTQMPRQRETFCRFHRSFEVSLSLGRSEIRKNEKKKPLKRSLGRTQMKTLPPLASLNAGEVFLPPASGPLLLLVSVFSSSPPSPSRRTFSSLLYSMLLSWAPPPLRLISSSPPNLSRQTEAPELLTSCVVSLGRFICSYSLSLHSIHGLSLLCFSPFPSRKGRKTSPLSAEMPRLSTNSKSRTFGQESSPRWNTVSQLFPALGPSWNSVKSIYSPPPHHLSPLTPHLCFAFPFNYRSSSTVRFAPPPSDSPLRSSSPYQLLVSNPHKSLDMSFQSVAMELRLSSGFDESHGFRYGNIGVHLISWISVRSPSCLIVKSIASHPPRCLVTPIPSESRWYSTDTCFGLNQNHLRSLNVLIIIYLSHQSSSEASCLSWSAVAPQCKGRVSFSSEFVTGAIRFQGPAYLFASSKSRTLLLFVSDEIHVVSSGNIEVGVRAVHARSTSFQTWQFGLINVVCDDFMLVVVAYSGTHLLLPTVLHLSSKTLMLALLSLGLVFVFYDVLQTVEDPSGYYLVTIEHSSGCNRLNSF